VPSGDTTSGDTTIAASTSITGAAAAPTALTDAALLALIEGDSELFGEVKWGTQHQGRSRLGIIKDPRFVRKEVQEGAISWKRRTQNRILMLLFVAADGRDLYSFVQPK
jgi:hypothetical protein